MKLKAVSLLLSSLFLAAAAQGADLLQIYTGFIYGGPVLVKEINEGIAERVRAAGFSCVADAVGTGSADNS